MTPAEQPKPNAPATDANQRIEERLARIEKSVDTLVKKNTPEEPAASPSSKPVLAAAFGLVGLKLGGFVGAKVGLLTDMGRGYAREGWEGAKRVWETIFTFGKNERYKASDTLKYTIAATGILTVAGAVGGVLLGWNRGDRLKSPGDLFAHPVDSMKKIFGPAPKKTPPSPAGKTADAPGNAVSDNPIVSSAMHEGTVLADAQALQR